jgi:DNA invertase Pin-like site-specific DNA recombinase
MGFEKEKAMRIGYAHVSTGDQNLALQTDALEWGGCDRLFTDKASGSRADRLGLKEALSPLRSGGTLVVWKLDRLGRGVAPGEVAQNLGVLVPTLYRWLPASARE